MINIRKIISKVYMKYLLNKEKTFKGKKCVLKYLYFKKRKSRYLLIVFSGFPGEGKAKYNYIRKFKRLKCNKLYILDDFGYDCKGSYYLGKNNDFFVEEAVDKLIEEVAKKYNIFKSKIICAGSSKGGYAALYFAIKYRFGYAVAGAPQILLGNYLKVPKHQHILKYIFGGINEKEINNANNLLFEVIDSMTNYPNLYLHIGENDEHFQNDVIPFIDRLKSKDILYYLDIQKGEDHKNIGVYYPKYANKVIHNIIHSKS